MTVEQRLIFPPFRLDVVNECVWCGEQEIHLPPKAFAVLRYLIEHRGRLVTKEELFRAVWSETVVSDAALTVCIQEVRKALSDRSQEPRFIETVHRRGYRFIAPLTAPQPVASSQNAVGSRELSNVRELMSRVQSKQSSLPSPRYSVPTLVGRAAELAQLYEWFAKAAVGERQVVFVTGEPGIGKTTLVEAFLQTLNSRCQTPDTRVWLGRGQCIEQYGAGEAYLPVLEALGRLCRESGGEQVVSLLDQHAPTWLVQMPAFLASADFEALQRKVAGATRERMLREMAEALEVLTTERPLVLVLEDLHWSDASTLDLLSVIARRRERARLLVIGTYRPVEVNRSGHPLKTIKQDLQLHRQCEELSLTFLTEDAVAEYVAVKLAGEGQQTASFHELVLTIHQRTEGNPLFIVNVVDYLITRGALNVGEAGEGHSIDALREHVQVGVPDGLRQMIVQQIGGLSEEERRVLEAASVVGMGFSAAVVAAAVEQDTTQVEEMCEGLVQRQQFLRFSMIEEWPDGTVAGHYSFIHALYQNVLYERLSVGRRIQLHKRIGERKEAGYGERAGEIAAELAVHFERGRDYQRAVHYFE